MKAVRLENLGTKTPPGKSAEEWRRKKKNLMGTGGSSAPAESGETGGKDTGATGTPPERRPTYSETMQGYYGDRYADALAENKTAADAAAETAERDAQDALERIRGGYKSTDRQLYREYMESKRTLPQRLAAQGITGGLTESSQVRLANSYGEELAENERARLAEEAKTYSARDARLAAARAEQSRADAEAKRTHGESLAKLWQEAEKHRREGCRAARRGGRLLRLCRHGAHAGAGGLSRGDLDGAERRSCVAAPRAERRKCRKLRLKSRRHAFRVASHQSRARRGRRRGVYRRAARLRRHPERRGGGDLEAAPRFGGE